MAGKNVTIGNVNISMSANAAALVRQVDKASNFFNKKVRKMIKTSKNLAKSMVNVGKKLAKFSGFVGGALAAGFAALALKTYAAQREMQRMSDVAGVSMGKFAAMTHITKSLGLETEYLADSMKDLNVRIVDAAKGGGTMVDFFDLMGQNAQDWVDLDPAAQLDKFVKITDKLSDNDAKFWSDEINDSMFRLSSTLRRSGKSMADFQAEAESLGAGTAAMFIGNINGMYESFSRLSLLINEFKGTTFALLASSFGASFDGMTESLKKFLGEGEDVSENIFNTSKKIAETIIKFTRTTFIAVKAFVNKIMVLASKFDKSFVDGLYSIEQEAKIAKLNADIDDTRDNIRNSAEADWVSNIMGYQRKSSAEAVAVWKKTLGEMIVERDSLVGNTKDSKIILGLDELLANLESQTFDMAKAAEDIKDNSTSTMTQDPAILKLATKFLKDRGMASTEEEDSVLKQITLNKENLRVLLAHYDTIVAQGLVSDKVLETQKAAYDALEKLDKDKAAREKAMLRDKVIADSTSGEDPNALKAAEKFLRQRNKLSTQENDHILRKIALNKENLRVLLVTYEALAASGLATDATIAAQKDAHDALAQLDKDKAARDKALAKLEAEELQTKADKELEIVRRKLEARLGFEKEYGIKYQGMSDTQEQIKKDKLQALYDNERISKEEHTSALLQLSIDKAGAEVSMELGKLANIANGLQAFTGKSEKMAKAAFAFTQGKALAEVVIQQAKAVAAVWGSDMHWTQKVGASISAAATVGTQIQSIKAAGQFHDGGEIPYDGTYYMEGGEMVIPKDRVNEYMDNAGSGGSGGTVINSSINMGANLVDEGVMAQALSKQQTVLALLIKKEEQKRPSRNRSRNK